MTENAGMTSQEETQQDGHATGTVEQPEVQPPLPLDLPLPPEVSPSANPPPMMPISDLSLPILDEIVEANANRRPANVMTAPSSSSPKRPWSATESNGNTSDDTHNVPPKKCKTCNLAACIERYHLEKVNEMVRKNLELKKKIHKANELNARLDAIIQDLDTQGPMNRDIVRALLRSEPEDVDLDFDGDE